MFTNTMWGGFCDDKLDMSYMDDKWGGENMRHVPALFTSRKAAREQYQDVRRINLTELPKAK